MLPEPAFRGRKVLVVAAYDSFLRSAVYFAKHLEQGGAQVEYVLAEAGRNQLSLAQARACGLSFVPPVVPLAQIASRAWLHGRDLVLLALDGARARRFTVGLGRSYEWGRHGRRPLTMAFYPGLLFRFHLEGMFSRMSSDLFLLNSPHDYELYAQMLAALDVTGNNSLMAGLSTIPARSATPRALPAQGSILFVGQPTVPVWKHERLYLLHRLAELADRFPQTPIVYKPRHRKKETTLHKELHHAEDLLAELGRMRTLPRNLRLSYDGMRELLSEARVCVTVSSTAALEALALNIPTRIVTDFGIHEHLGNHFFLGSGLFCQLGDLHPDLAWQVEARWSERHLAAAGEHLAELDARLLQLLSQRDHARALPFPYGRLFGRPTAYDDFVRTHFDVDHLSLLAEKKVGTRLGRARAAGKQLVTRLRRGL